MFRRKIKAKENKDTKTKEIVKVLVRPISVKKLRRKESKSKKIEEFVDSNEKSVVQSKVKAEIVETKTDLVIDFKIVDMNSLVVKEKSVHEHKATEKIGQQVEKIAKNFKIVRAKNSKVKQKASAMNTLANTLVEQSVEQRKQLKENWKLLKLKNVEEKTNKQLSEREI